MAWPTVLLWVISPPKNPHRHVVRSLTAFYESNVKQSDIARCELDLSGFWVCSDDVEGRRSLRQPRHCRTEEQRLGPRDRRLQSRSASRSETCPSVRQPRACQSTQGRPRRCHRRLQPGFTTRSEKRQGLLQPRQCQKREARADCLRRCRSLFAEP